MGLAATNSASVISHFKALDQILIQRSSYNIISAQKVIALQRVVILAQRHMEGNKIAGVAAVQAVGVAVDQAVGVAMDQTVPLLVELGEFYQWVTSLSVIVSKSTLTSET